MTKIYENGFEAVSALDLDIPDGEFLVLVGPSGCGKTTALRMIAGLEDITKGELRIGGRRVNEVPSRDRDIAMVFQSYALYPHMNVADNISFGLKLRKMPKDEIDRRLERARRDAGPPGSARPPSAAAVGRPAPAGGDGASHRAQPGGVPDGRAAVQPRRQVARADARRTSPPFSRKLAVTTVYVTHDQIEAMTMGDRVAVMRKGVLQQVDAPQVLYDEPVNLFVGGFIGSPPMNMAEAQIAEHGEGLAVEFGDQRVTLDPETAAARPALRGYIGKMVAAGIRSEDLFAPGPRHDAPEDQRLRSTAMLTEALGSEIVVHFVVPAPPVRTEDAKELEEDTGMADISQSVEIAGSKFVASFSPRSHVRPGDQIEVGVDTTRLYFFDLDTGLAIRQ